MSMCVLWQFIWMEQQLLKFGVLADPGAEMCCCGGGIQETRWLCEENNPMIEGCYICAVIGLS